MQIISLMKRARKSYKTKYYNLYWNESLQQRIRFAYCIFVFTNLKRNSCTSVSKKLYVLSSSQQANCMHQLNCRILIFSTRPFEFTNGSKKFEEILYYLHTSRFFFDADNTLYLYSFQCNKQQKIMRKQSSSNVQIFFAVVTLQ